MRLASGGPSRLFEIGENGLNTCKQAISGNFAKMQTKGVIIVEVIRNPGILHLFDTVSGRDMSAIVYHAPIAGDWRFMTLDAITGKTLMIRKGLTLRHAFKALRNHIEGLPPGSPDVTEEELQAHWQGWA